MKDHINTKLQCILEGTVITEANKEVELDLKNEKWCACKDPSGFKFIKYEGHEQIWRHIVCGGLYIKSLITNKR